MIKKTLTVLLLIWFFTGLYSQEKENDISKNEKIPERISVSLDALLKTMTSNGVYSLKYIDSFFYVLKNSVYVNFLFSADLLPEFKLLKKKKMEEFNKEKSKYEIYVSEKKKKIELENKRIELKNSELKDSSRKIPLIHFTPPSPPILKSPDHYFDLYMRVINGGTVIQRFRSPVPFWGEKDTEYFSFGIILRPGNYNILVDINAYDNSKDGTLITGLNVPELTLPSIVNPSESLTFSKPVFFKKIDTFLKAEKRFTVERNMFRIGVMRKAFYPYLDKDHVFSSTDIPLLAYFVKGAKMTNGWSIETAISIFKGKKRVSVFKPFLMRNPYFFQPIKFVGKSGKLLGEGRYLIQVDMNDNNSKGVRGVVKIPFSISR